MANTRRAAMGYLVEDRPEGLYLIGDNITLARAEWDARLNAHMRTVEDANGFLVELDHGEIPPFGDDGQSVAEWGRADNLEDAKRYAFGAHFGSYDDPIVS